MSPNEVADHLALRQTAELYAVGADRRDKAIWSQVLTDDIEITGPGFGSKGIEDVLKSLDYLAQFYAKTQHRVHNQIVSIDGDSATGETYSTADHLTITDGKGELLCWSIRYQDQWRKVDGAWRFSRRELIVDWEEKRAL
ncbi:nuclear transport factor 2 family protein [Sphingomonas sp. C3-2]|uniref:nuclear transport factor 2 family protein n=1 Tax=Sphingomonas sp. C3-2 TaxID=3062169 RepID=UPI00294AACF8|nr:nuclear transport factor 2 family protein [Sphingomonas sp. C3-2]WOK37203.1 nuclear transport factor 2 family protein [Sphingomonas sp. C3-2]